MRTEDQIKTTPNYLRFDSNFIQLANSSRFRVLFYIFMMKIMKWYFAENSFSLQTAVKKHKTIEKLKFKTLYSFKLFIIFINMHNPLDCKTPSF